jgi:hypothetical protein
MPSSPYNGLGAILVMRYQRAAWIGGAVGAIVAIAIFPVFQAWVNEFQTLITGLLAVFAAHYTVRQMRRSDKKSDDRHNQLMELSLRPTRLKVSRSVFPTLLGFYDAIADAKKYIARCNVEITSNYESFVELIRDIEGFCATISGALADPQLMQAYELFDGKMSDSFNRAVHSNKSLQDQRHLTQAAITNERHQWKDADEVFHRTKHHINDIFIELELLRLSLVEFSESLREFGLDYEASFKDRPARDRR